ncbi:MAG: hypothetical protein BWZ02_00466 [Lentisphaerae bacterium ADurb.BinA184]|nr:MAG: hypothetical protein BWZ02_00466 [Lentisphaerae bacterium ADurb.BinA184]
MRLANDYIRLEFDERTGSLIQLEDRCHRVAPRRLAWHGGSSARLAGNLVEADARHPPPAREQWDACVSSS